MLKVSVLVHSGCYNKSQDWEAYKQQQFVSHSSVGGKSKIKVPALLGSDEGPIPDCRLLISRCVLTWKKAQESLWGPFYRGTNSTHESLLDITLGGRISTCEFWRDSSTQTIAARQSRKTT